MKSKFVFWAACVAYVGALTMPAIIVQDNSYTDAFVLVNWYGFEILKNGVFGILVGQWAWFANIFLLVGLFEIGIGRYVGGMWCFGAAFVLGLQTLAIDRYNEGESPFFYIVHHFGPGFYFWELSFLLFFLYCWLCWKQKQKDKIKINIWVILLVIFMVGLAARFMAIVK